jgi:hypothetical protein
MWLNICSPYPPHYWNVVAPDYRETQQLRAPSAQSEASGRPTAAPPINVMNSRRRIRPPKTFLAQSLNYSSL